MLLLPAGSAPDALMNIREVNLEVFGRFFRGLLLAVGGTFVVFLARVLCLCGLQQLVKFVFGKLQRRFLQLNNIRRRTGLPETTGKPASCRLQKSSLLLSGQRFRET